MEENKAFCVNCLNEVDPDTHVDCTLTFEDLLSVVESAGTENGQKNKGETTMQRPQVSNPSIYQGGNEGNNLVERKPDFANPKIPIQDPTYRMPSSRNSTGHRILGAYNPSVQLPENTEYANSISRHEGDNRFQQNKEETTVQRPQVSNPSIYQRGNEGNNLLERKPDFANPETLIQDPTYRMPSSRNSTDPRILGAYNPSVQLPENTEYANSISRHEGDNTFLYDPAQLLYPENPLHPHAMYIGNRNEQTAFGSIQRENEFSNAMPQSNERNRFYQEHPQSSYRQTSVKNNFQPYNIPDLSTAYHKPISNKIMNVSEHTEHQPHFNYPQPKKRYPSYEPQVNMMNSNDNMRVENYSENLKKSSSGPEHTVALNYVTQDKITVSKEQNLTQNQLPSPYLVSKTKIPSENRYELDSVHNRFMQICSQSTQQKNTERSTQQKITERRAHQEIKMRSTPQQNAERNAHQKNAKRSTPQKNAEQSVQQKKVRSSSEKHAERSVQKKDAEKTVQKKHVERSVQEKTAEKSVPEKDAKSVPEKVAEKSVQEKVAEKSVQEKDAEQSVQENSRRFTGEGYKSLDEFIKALYDGTLYKRY